SRLGGAQSRESARGIHHCQLRFSATLPAEGQRSGAPARPLRRTRLRHHRASRADDPAARSRAHRRRSMTRDHPFWGYEDLALFVSAVLPSFALAALAVRAARLSSDAMNLTFSGVRET